MKADMNIHFLLVDITCAMYCSIRDDDRQLTWIQLSSESVRSSYNLIGS